MRGPEGVSALLLGIFTANMPAKVAELVARYGLNPAPAPGQPETPNTLVAPALYAAEERGRLESEEWPAILVNAIATPLVRLVDLHTDTAVVGVADPDAGASVYSLDYRLRSYLYARGADYPDTDLARKRLLLGMRELILTHLDLDAAAPGTATINPNTLTESLSNLEPATGGRTVGAGYIELTVRSYEVARPTPAAAIQAAQVIGTVTRLA